MSEHCYYQRGAVKITLTRAVFGHKTYALNGITSVARIVLPPNRNGPIFVLGLGIIALVPAISEATDYPIPVFVLGLAIIALAVWWWSIQKPLFAVRLCTSAREFQAYVSRNQGEMDAIITAIEQAIIDRG